MKNSFFSLILFICVLLVQIGNAQSDNADIVLPLNPNPSPVFGKDIIIHSLPYQNQRHIAISSAPNGWLYAAYGRDSINRVGFILLRSKDNGLTWNQLYNGLFPSNINCFNKLNISATMADSTNPKVLLSYCCNYNEDTNYFDIMDVVRCACEPFAFEKSFCNIQTVAYHDISHAWDNDYPALNANPNSVGTLFSRTKVKDSLIFLSSSDGGMSFNNHKVVAISINNIHKVALAYGRSLSQNTGQYYAVWEEQADSTSNLGHIFASHSNPNFNSPFTTPVMLDGLDPSLTNLCRNPVIACQANNIDNDSSNVTEVILFEKYDSTTHEYDIIGFYNKKAATGTTFSRMNIATGLHNQLQPDITFNSFDSTFVVTYYDSTDQKLVMLKNDMNLTNPDNWIIVSTGYNDSYTLSAPHPKISVNMGNHSVITGWSADRENGNGVALFDAPYVPNAGFNEEHDNGTLSLIGVSPNPCNTSITISFRMIKTEKVIFTLYNSFGQQIRTFFNQMCYPGVYNINGGVVDFPNGIYFLRINYGNYDSFVKILILR